MLVAIVICSGTVAASDKPHLPQWPGRPISVIIFELDWGAPPRRYCGVRSNLTIDHVRPTSKGGDWSWENLVTACVKCNGKKGDSTLKQLGWKLKKQPQVALACWVLHVTARSFS